MPSKKYAVVDKNRCVACGACMNVCPKDAVHIWKGCYAAPVPDKCIGCGKCAKICPAGCIQIRNRGEQKWEQNTGMIIFGYGPSFTLLWDFLISYLPGLEWSTFCFPSWSLPSEEINGSVITCAAEASSFIFSAAPSNVHEIKPPRDGWFPNGSAMAFSSSFLPCSAIWYSRPGLWHPEPTV